MIDAKNYIICPGFIDIQINGAFGVDFSDPNLSEDDMKKVRRNLLSVLPAMHSLTRSPVARRFAQLLLPLRSARITAT